MAETVSVRVHAAIFNGKIHRNCIVTYSPADNSIPPSITAFSGEIHSTSSYNGIVIFAPPGFTLPTGLEISYDIRYPERFTGRLDSIASSVPACTAPPYIPLFLPL